MKTPTYFEISEGGGKILRDMEADPRLKHVHFEPAHTLEVIRREGPRCRACGRRYDGEGFKSMLCGDTHCKTLPSDPRFHSFVNLVLQLQDYFFDYRRVIKSAVLPPCKGLARQELAWWLLQHTMRYQCEISLEVLSICWIRRVVDGEGLDNLLKGFITSTKELKIRLPCYYHHMKHCVFYVKLKDGTQWIFDPTGVQHGPQWPLLSSLDEFQLRSTSSDPGPDTFCEVHRLGHNYRREYNGRLSNGAETDDLDSLWY